jgi:CheY-like chemotaxis protein/HPt (histidine-containing phosphotransfer) domain-containing protein
MDPKGKKPAQIPQNSVHMDAHSVGELFDEMDRRTSGTPQELRRTCVRWPHHLASCVMKVFHSGSSPVTINVACRNISAHGMSVLHSSYLHAKTRVIITLPLLTGQLVDVEGTIIHSSHVRGICHEVGIKFKIPIDIRTMVQLDPFEGGFVLEKVDPETLMGTILYVDDSALGQSLVKHFLRETALRLRVAEDFTSARTMIEDGVDLILCDYLVKGQNGAEFVTLLRQAGVTTPAIFITSDNSESTRAKFAKAQAGAILTKPVSQTLLLRALAEFLLTGKGVGVTTSALPENHPGAAMLDRFIGELGDHSKALDKAVSTGNADVARTIALQIAGIAPTMGFPTLAQFAHEAERALNATMSVEESAPQISRLVRLCREIKSKRAA